MRNEYFFEMLTEEIPAWMLRSRLQLLEQELRSFYGQHVGAPDTIAMGQIQCSLTCWGSQRHGCDLHGGAGR